MCSGDFIRNITNLFFYDLVFVIELRSSFFRKGVVLLNAEFQTTKILGQHYFSNVSCVFNTLIFQECPPGKYMSLLKTGMVPSVYATLTNSIKDGHTFKKMMYIGNNNTQFYYLYGMYAYYISCEVFGITRNYV